MTQLPNGESGQTQVTRRQKEPVKKRTDTVDVRTLLRARMEFGV